MSYPFLSDLGIKEEDINKYAIQTIIEDISKHTSLDIDDELLKSNKPNLGEINGIY